MRLIPTHDWPTCPNGDSETLHNEMLCTIVLGAGTCRTDRSSPSKTLGEPSQWQTRLMAPSIWHILGGYSCLVSPFTLQGFLGETVSSTLGPTKPTSLPRYSPMSMLAKKSADASKARDCLGTPSAEKKSRRPHRGSTKHLTTTDGLQPTSDGL